MAYRACSGEESAHSFDDVSLFRFIRSAAADYASGKTPPPGGLTRKAVSTCRIYDRSTHFTLAPGDISQLYEKYMTPGAFDVEEISPSELARCAGNKIAPIDAGSFGRFPMYRHEGGRCYSR